MGADRELPYSLTLCMVNYNGEKYLEESLGSVFLQKEKYVEILLIDNASVDRSLQIVSDRFPDVKVIKLEKNRGPGVARNEGFRGACTDLILFVDNDVSLAPDCAEKLLIALKESPQAALAMPRVVYANDKNVIQFDGADSHFLGLMTLHNVNRHLDESTSETRRIGSVVASCVLIDCNKWGSEDPFDENFFFNYEDHDFGLRARILGHDILSVPSAICYHQEGTEGLSLRQGGKYSKIRVYNLIRNRWQLILKNYEFRTLLLLSPIFFIYETFQLFGVVKKGWIIEWVKAFLWIGIHPIQILKKRRVVNSLRKIPDRDILSNTPIPFRQDGLIESRLERKMKNLLDLTTNCYWNKISKYV